MEGEKREEEKEEVLLEEFSMTLRHLTIPQEEKQELLVIPQILVYFRFRPFISFYSSFMEGQLQPQALPSHQRGPFLPVPGCGLSSGLTGFFDQVRPIISPFMCIWP